MNPYGLALIADTGGISARLAHSNPGYMKSSILSCPREFGSCWRTVPVLFLVACFGEVTQFSGAHLWTGERHTNTAAAAVFSTCRR